MRRPAFLYAIAACSVWLIAPRTPVYWDSFGYVVQAISGQVGGLGFGRPIFVLVSHALARAWLAAGGSPWQIEPLLRLCWAAVACAAAPLTWGLALRCGLGRHAAWIAGLAVACSPALAHTSGTLLTDGPATACVLLACVLAARAVSADSQRDGQASTRAAVAAGAALGLAIGLREQSVLGAPTLALIVFAAPRPAWTRLALLMGASCVVVTAAPVTFVLLRQPGYLEGVQGWLAGMAHDRALKTFDWRDVGLVAGWVVSLGPAVALASIPGLARRAPVWPPGTVIFAVVVPALVELLWMALFQGITYSPRYLLPAFPGALAIPGGWWLGRWAGESRTRVVIATAAVVLPLIVAAPIVATRSAPLEATMRDWPSRVMAVPARGVIVSGQPCPAVAMVRAIVARDPHRAGPVPDWQAVCPGWAWPSDLTARLDGAIAAGRPVVLDLRPGSWIGDEQRAARAQADRYARAHTAEQARRVLIVWR